VISREYAGVVLIAIVFSTVLTSFMIGEKPKRLVEIIRNDAPPLNSGSDEKFGYSLTLVFRRDFDEVRVDFAWFRGMPLLLVPGANETGIATLDAALPGLLKMKTMNDLLSRFGVGPERIGKEYLRGYWPQAEDILLLDYSKALSAGMKDQSNLVHAIYIFVLKDSKISGYYEGVADFFPEREWREVGGGNLKPVRDPRSGGSIEFGLDENRTKYVSPGEKKLYPELPSLSGLPPYGELVFRNVKKDQRLTVMTFIQGRTLAFRSQRELIRVYLDGKLELVQINPP